VGVGADKGGAARLVVQAAEAVGGPKKLTSVGCIQCPAKQCPCGGRNR